MSPDGGRGTGLISSVCKMLFDQPQAAVNHLLLAVCRSVSECMLTAHWTSAGASNPFWNAAGYPEPLCNNMGLVCHSEIMLPSPLPTRLNEVEQHPLRRENRIHSQNIFLLNYGR